VFQGDAINAPRRVRLQWKARGAGVWQRFFGPGVTSSAALQLGAAAVCMGTIATVGLLLSLAEEYGPATAPLGIVALALPAAMFVLFTVGLAMWLRVRFGTNVGRVALAVVIVVIFVAPYAVTAILGGDATETDSIVPLLASPSPAFALEVARRVAMDQTDARAVMAVLGCSAVYAVLGLVALSAGAVKADRIVAALDADAARMDGLIAQEDHDASRASAVVAKSESSESSNSSGAADTSAKG
jgi:hypothetical protein